MQKSIKEKIIIIGAGGHAKVVLNTLMAMGESIEGFLDDNSALFGVQILGHTVLGPISLLEKKAGQCAILGIGDNKTRKQIYLQYPGVHWKTAIHPKAYVADSVQIGHGVLICAGVVIQPEVKIANHVIVNTSASVDHDCIINDYCHVAPGVHLGGHVVLEEGSFLGIGSCAIPGIIVGKWTMIGAGSVLVRSIEEGAFAKGVPAKSYQKIPDSYMTSLNSKN